MSLRMFRKSRCKLISFKESEYRKSYLTIEKDRFSFYAKDNSLELEYSIYKIRNVQSFESLFVVVTYHNGMLIVIKLPILKIFTQIFEYFTELIKNKKPSFALTKFVVCPPEKALEATRDFASIYAISYIPIYKPAIWEKEYPKYLEKLIIFRYEPKLVVKKKKDKLKIYRRKSYDFFKEINLDYLLKGIDEQKDLINKPEVANQQVLHQIQRSDVVENNLEEQKPTSTIKIIPVEELIEIAERSYRNLATIENKKPQDSSQIRSMNDKQNAIVKSDIGKTNPDLTNVKTSSQNNISSQMKVQTQPNEQEEELKVSIDNEDDYLEDDNIPQREANETANNNGVKENQQSPSFGEINNSKEKTLIDLERMKNIKKRQSTEFPPLDARYGSGMSELERQNTKRQSQNVFKDLWNEQDNKNQSSEAKTKNSYQANIEPAIMEKSNDDYKSRNDFGPSFDQSKMAGEPEKNEFKPSFDQSKVNKSSISAKKESFDLEHNLIKNDIGKSIMSLSKTHAEIREDLLHTEISTKNGPKNQKTDNTQNPFRFSFGEKEERNDEIKNGEKDKKIEQSIIKSQSDVTTQKKVQFN